MLWGHRTTTSRSWGILVPSVFGKRTPDAFFNKLLERKRQSTLNSPRRLRQEKRMSIRRQEGLIPLRQQVRHVDRGLKPRRQSVTQAYRLAHIEAEVRLVAEGLVRIHRCDK